jgi:hypothetical protein
MTPEKKFYSVVAVVLLITLNECKPKQVCDEALIKYMQDEKNGLKQTKEIGDLNLTAMYKPNDLIVAQELKSQRPLTEERIKTAKKIFEMHCYIIFSISKAGNEVLINPKSASEYNERLSTMLFGMSNYITLLGNGQDTLKMEDFTYPRTYGASRSTDMLFAFERGKEGEYDYLELIVDEFGFGTGINKFRFSMRDINRVPDLNFKCLMN